MIFGTISSINEQEMHAYLMFEKETLSKNLLDRYQFNRHLKWSYNYSKIMQARDFQERSKPSKLGTIMRKSFLWYPSSKSDGIAGFSFLSDVLCLKACAVPKTLQNPLPPKVYVDIVVLSMGSLFGRYWPRSHQEKVEYDQPFHPIAEPIEISGHLSITGEQFHNLSLFFEGLYDPVVGQMYMIGCRDVRAFQNSILNGTNLEGGMDSLDEVRVQYPSRNARWLQNTKIKFSINSKRSKEDPLHRIPTSLDTFLLSYQKKLDYVIFRKSFETVIRVLMITVAILCTLSQSRHSENEGHSTAYMSLVMVGIHSLGYGIPLITGDEVLFRWKELSPNNSQTYDFGKFQRFQVLDCSIKILLLVALLLTTKLLQKIWESRSRQLDHDKKLKPQMPSDKIVFLITLFIHIIVFSICHCIRNGFPPLQSGNYMYGRGYMKNFLKWWGELENYAGLVQDFFLLPQIIGNALWHIQGKPLSKFYYLGFTMVRVLLHAYDYARDPVPSRDHGDNEFQYMGLEFYS
ncbi:unnamed protein product [Ilex paraguariensis]|uniref:RING-type E3 ubiquitin transferase n=1 Tax=Ilex paraguariensis TaxID=185542 RepID=A0ABC8SC85_9AQUA